MSRADILMHPESGDGLDPMLFELFRAAETPLEDVVADAFCAEVARRVRRLRLWRHLRVTAGWLAAGCALALLLNYGAADLARLGQAASLAAQTVMPRLGLWLISPAGWACSLAIGVAALWRSRVFRR